MPSVVGNKPDQVLLDLTEASFPRAFPSHLRLCSAALYHHSQMQFTRVHLLENVLSASGKFEPGLTRQDSLKWLQNWAKMNPAEVRKVLWHAGVLSALLAEFPQGWVWRPSHARRFG